MMSVALFALVVLIGAAMLIAAAWLLKRWSEKIHDPDVLPKPVKVRKSKKGICALPRRRVKEYPDGRKEFGVQQCGMKGEDYA